MTLEITKEQKEAAEQRINLMFEMGELKGFEDCAMRHDEQCKLLHLLGIEIEYVDAKTIKVNWKAQ